MKERIIQFLSTNNLTSTKFADVVGVQRSSISHILSGRNKPSFDFIEKMLIAYPDVNAQWLITGKGNMFMNQSSLFNDEKSQKLDNLSALESNISEITSSNEEKINPKKEFEFKNMEQKSNIEINSDIERVIIFYINGSFKEYKPE